MYKYKYKRFYLLSFIFLFIFLFLGSFSFVVAAGTGGGTTPSTYPSGVIISKTAPYGGSASFFLPIPIGTVLTDFLEDYDCDSYYHGPVTQSQYPGDPSWATRNNCSFAFNAPISKPISTGGNIIFEILPPIGNYNTYFKIKPAITTPVGTYNFTVDGYVFRWSTGSSPSNEGAKTVSLKLTTSPAPAPTLNISASPTSVQLVKGGTSVSSTITTTFFGISGDINYEIDIGTSDLNVLQDLTNPGGTITIGAGTANPGTYTVTVSGSGNSGAVSDSVNINVTVAASVPTCTTPTATYITPTSATIGGNITSDGGASITSRGVYLGTSANPTSGGGTVTGTTGVLTKSITGLTAGTTYHYRAYATNSAGTGYCPDATFTTLIPDLTTGSVSPTTAKVNEARTYSATVSNIGNGATAAVSINHLFQFDENSDHSSGVTTSVYTSSPNIISVGGSITVSREKTFTSSGTKYIRVCADNNASFVGTITESNENNNCGPWTEITVASPSTPVYPSGTISATDCTIAENSSTCDSSLTWTVSDLVLTGATAVTKNKPTANTSVFSDASYDGTENLARSNFSNTIGHGTTTFYLYHNGGELDHNSANASCVSGTDYLGGKCIVIPPLTPTASLSVSPSSISSGDPVVITWYSTDTDSCVGTGFSTNGAISGTVTVNPTVETTYSLSCDDGEIFATDSETVTIKTTGKKPKYIEN